MCLCSTSLAIAGLAWFPVYMAPPVLLALGANRDRLLVDLIGRLVAAIGLCGAAFFGILAMAASKLVTMPFHMMLAFWLIRRHVPFRWRELGAVLEERGHHRQHCSRSACGRDAIRRGFALSFSQTVIALALAAVGWLASVLLAQHPILLELRRAFDEFAELPALRRLRARLAWGPRAGEVR